MMTSGHFEASSRFYSIEQLFLHDFSTGVSRQVKDIAAGMRDRQRIVIFSGDADGERRLQIFEAKEAGPFTRCDKFEKQRLLLFFHFSNYVPKPINDLKAVIPHDSCIFDPICHVDCASA